MGKQQSLKEHRDYNQRPRVSTEIDWDFRHDIGDFEESPVKQSEAPAADINNIMKRFNYDFGNIPASEKQQLYGDFSDPGSFQEAMEVVAFANSQFSALPAHIRAFFQNDPQRMLQFVEDAASDPKKGDKLVEFGLADIRKPAPETAEDVLRGIRDNTKPQKTKQKPDSGASSED